MLDIQEFSSGREKRYESPLWHLLGAVTYDRLFMHEFDKRYLNLLNKALCYFFMEQTLFM